MATSLTAKGVLVCLLLVLPAAILVASWKQPAQNQEADDAAAPVSVEAAGQVSSDNLRPWPLVVPDARLKCRPVNGRPVATVATSAGEYALNGAARAAGYPELGALWLDDESNPGAKVQLSAMIQTALTLCHAPAR